MLPKRAAGFSAVRFKRGELVLKGIPSFAGIYRITCLATKQGYVGQTYDFAKRAIEHQACLMKRVHSNTRLQLAYDRYGASQFVFEVLEVYHGTVRQDTLTPAEQRWMDRHERRALFNVRPAGTDKWLARNAGPASSTRGKSRKDWRTTLDATRSRPLGRRRGSRGTDKSGDD